MSTNLFYSCDHVCECKFVVYDKDMGNTEDYSEDAEGPQIDLDRLRLAIERRGWNAARLVVESGVHKSTVSLLLSGDRPNSPAVIVARLAVALGVSVDYLVGLTRNPAPRPDDLTHLLVELQGAARQLPIERQQDLILIAHAFRQTLDAADDAEMQSQYRFEQAALNVLERRYGREQAEEILAVLASEFPELGPALGGSGTVGGNDIPPGEEDAA